jgi:hypothetical protein
MTQRYVLIDTDDLTGLKLGPVYTVTAPTESSYLDAASADTLAASRPTNTAWAAASSVEKLAALEEATRRIDSMILRGTKYDSDQALEFPRIIDGVAVGNADQDAEVPTPVLWACLEEAIAILAAGSGSLKDLQEQGVSSMSVGGKLSYTFIAGAGNSGLQSAAANRYMRRYIGAEVR